MTVAASTAPRSRLAPLDRDLRRVARGDRLPAIAATLTAAVGAVNVISALTPELPGRVGALSTAAPQEVVLGAHALALPAGLALVAAAGFLHARRQRAQQLAVGLLLALGLLNLLKGLDVEEALLSWGLAGVLVWGRGAFRVRHDDDLPHVLAASCSSRAIPSAPLVRSRTLLRDVCAYADDHGLRPAAIGVSERVADLGAAVGLRKIYLGDEALVDTATFSLEGRAIRKVRQSVTRLGKAGYTVGAQRVGELDAAERAELETVSEHWRQGEPEIGFSMGMDSLANPVLTGTLAMIARDAEGAARGFVHFVPAAGGSVLSLSLMRRDRDTPNGLSELLVVRAIEHARAIGVAEISLNFAVGGKYMRAPKTRFERGLGRFGRWLDKSFQTDSLYRFNAKFSPRWQPRYVLFDGYRSFPRTALAGLWVEGQMARPRWLERTGDLLGRSRPPEPA